MVAESYDIARETYLAILMDRAFQGPVIVASPKGGVDIEEVAKNTPEHIHKVTQLTSFLDVRVFLLQRLYKWPDNFD